MLKPARVVVGGLSVALLGLVFPASAAPAVERKSGPTPEAKTAPAPAPSPMPAITPREPPGPKREVAPRLDVIAVDRLTVDRPIAGLSQQVKVIGGVRNIGDRSLTNVEWRINLPNGGVATGTIASLAPDASATVDAAYTPTATGEQTVELRFDPAAKLEQATKERANNEARTKVIVVTATADQWRQWTTKAAAGMNQLLAVQEPVACFEGTINGPLLKVTRIDPGPDLTPSFSAMLGGLGVGQPVADATAYAFTTAFRGWAGAVQGVHPLAYPAFTAWPGRTAAPTASVPYNVAVLGGGLGLGSFGSAPIEASLRSKVGARVSEAGASEALKLLAASMSHQLLAWHSTQLFVAPGSGPVPTYAPPIVPAGPVVNGSIVKNEPCRHFK